MDRCSYSDSTDLGQNLKTNKQTNKQQVFGWLSQML